MRKIIRYEYEDDNIIAVCEDDEGNRWYEVIMRDGEIVF